MTISVKDAAGDTQTIEVPNANGRADADSSRPVALSNEDKAAIDALQTALETVETKLDALITSNAAIETAVEDTDPVDTTLSAWNGREYETVAASQTDQVLGATGGSGDDLDVLLIVPATTSPGAVSIKDGSGSAITVFTGGASSVTNLVPFPVPINARSTSGAWKVTTGANVSVIATGNFT